MKLLLILLSCLALSTGCGKKAEVNDPPDKSVLPSDAELYFHALQEVKSAVTNNNLALLKETLSRTPQIDLNQFLDDGDTFIITTIKKDFREIRNFLILMGAQLDKANTSRETPLIVAVSYNQSNSVQVLLEKKVDLERVDSNGNTALQLAIKKSLDDIALMLIKHGASLENRNKDGASILKLATENDVPKTLELIKSIQMLDEGAPSIASFRAMLANADHEQLKIALIQFPSIAYAPAYESINPLSLLIDVENEIDALKTAKLLLDYQSNVNGPLGAPETPLIKATTKKKINFVHFFLMKNANPSLLDKDGKSALIYAIELNQLEIVSLLLDFSANEIGACTTVKKMREKLSTLEEKEINQKIKNALGCRFFRFSLQSKNRN